MIDRIIHFSIKWRLFVVLLAIALIGAGLYAATRLPIDAVPDVTNDQVQINTRAPAFTPLEIEQYVTIPVELAMSSLPRKQEIRSISKFGLSQVSVIFEDGTDLYWARQLILERLLEAQRDLPPNVSPELAPISTGLGEVYQFTVEDSHDGEHHYSLMDLRTLLDWTIKPQLRTVPGVIEVNSFGGLEKQYEVLIDPAKLVSYGITLRAVFEALERNNSNEGGAYLERRGEQQLIRGVGLITSTRDIENIVVSAHQGVPVYVQNIGQVDIGSQIRQGAATKDGQGETVMGIAMLLKGENSRSVAIAVGRKIEEIQKSMPPGVRMNTFLDRSQLVDQTIHTATRNLIEGGIFVMLVLFLFLLQFRAGLIVSSAIPLSMLFAIIGMNYFNISANLMSLGAIDFGLIVDAAVIIVENCVRRLAEARQELGRALTNDERLQLIGTGTLEVRRASQFGEIIIIAAYIPVVSLAGIEGKMFRPMAFTVILALVGALLLSLTLIPALSAMFLREPRRSGGHDRNPIVDFFQRLYKPVLRITVSHRRLTAVSAALFVAGCVALLPLLGTEFLPKLDEGSIAINLVRLPSVSLPQAVQMTGAVEKALKGFPEVQTVVSRLGSPEIATDPMGPDMGDTYVVLKPKPEWTSAKTKEDLVNKMSERLESVPGMAYSFSQPIEFRMMELIEGIGSRSDVVVKLFGEDPEVLQQNGQRLAQILGSVKGAADVKVQQTSGLPVLQIRIDRERVARYGINVSDVQDVVRTAVAGTETTRVLDGTKRFELVARFLPSVRGDAEALRNLLVTGANGSRIPLAQLATLSEEEGPSVISREEGERLTTIEANVRGRDIGGFVTEARAAVDRDLRLPSGYHLQWGGLWEHLESGRNRLLLVVPVTFFIVFLLLFTTFHSLPQAALIFTGIPFAVTGGVLSLLLRGMTFSMSAGVGFIAVSGVAVLNGVVMLAFFNQLREQGRTISQAVMEGAVTRLRPVLMTAFVASLGFIPMAVSTTSGAEVQRPLATVVIGGLITSTLLTLLVLPAVYGWISKEEPEVEI